MKKIFSFLLLTGVLFAKDAHLYESQPKVIFTHNYLTKQQNSVSLEVAFNNAVLYMQQEEFLKAITLFKQTATILKIPSFLNIGISYYKLKSKNNAYLYLKKIYDLKEVAKEDPYSYMSASYYLYLISNDRSYLSSILDVANKLGKKNINEDVKRLVADTYIVLKDYESALKVIESMQYKDDLKMAIIYLKLNNHDMANIYLTSAYERYGNESTLDIILWLKVFNNLKSNNLVRLGEDIEKLQAKETAFYANRELPLRIYFNGKKYNSKEYLSKVVNFDEKRKIDMIYYFAPFVFIDRKEIFNDSVLGYVLKNNENIINIDKMIKYNDDLLSIIKKDPIIRVEELRNLLKNKTDVKSYEYYNLALCYAQIFDFVHAYKYFKKAYDLSHANKLYGAMVLMSAKRAKIKLPKGLETKVKNNLLAHGGDYDYLGKYIYKILIDKRFVLNDKQISITDRKSIFLRALHFIDTIDENGFKADEPLLSADVKDPIVYLFRELAKQKDESNYIYISRLQDSIPKYYNDYFLKGPQVITHFYIDLLKALGIFNKVNFEIKGEDAPSYLKTKALVQLYDGFPVQSIKILEELQAKYKLYDKYTTNLLAASFLEANDYSNALATLGMLQFEQDDVDARFLNGVQLLQNLKFNSAMQFFKTKYDGELIDFKIQGLDEYLESL